MPLCRNRNWSGVALAMSCVVGFGLSWQEPAQSSGSKSPVTSSADLKSPGTFEPVDDMHHFMELVSQPSYRALKDALKEEPKDRRVWRGVKTHAMILAETSALVAERPFAKLDEAQKKRWSEISVEVYAAGKELYKATGKYDVAKASYEKMIDACNRCHQEFDDGKHQLEK